MTVSAETDKGVHVEASAIFGAGSDADWPLVAPAGPESPAPEDLEVFAIPKEFLPIVTSVEIRPVCVSRPYAGGKEPELTAWITIVEDDDPPDVLRFVSLMDVLAPSYTAILSTLAFVPTVELTVRPGVALAQTSSHGSRCGRGRSRRARAAGSTSRSPPGAATAPLGDRPPAPPRPSGLTARPS
ncbi:hypothetical protein ACH492_04295 [Streptomyces sp. NPDC019443]|uniref:hypothetical protein n=1 Tax=Streptomyces sp. NPDC019443 TaxID=3365061 RepID=UPI0037A19F77